MFITEVRARQVLDSRGNPTVEAEVFSDAIRGRAIVPSGASTGIYEAVELRDKKKAYQGKGVLKAIDNIKSIAKKLKGIELTDQKKIDQVMIALDGKENKSKLGANAILAVSMAASRCAATALQIPLYEYLNKNFQFSSKFLLPIPFSNIINGGKHAGGKLQFQEFMIAPVKAKSFAEATQMNAEIVGLLKDLIAKKYGKAAVNVGDEGGFAPPLNNPDEALELLVNAIKQSGYAGKVKIAMDPASSEFYKEKFYYVEENKKLSTGEMVDYYVNLIKKYPIVSLEDPFQQEDFDAFAELKQKVPIQIVGDDLLVTNVKRIQMALQKNSCNALLLKVNQIGSLTESFAAAKLCMDNKWNVMVSHRSGETEDAFIADLAVGINCGQIKLGAPVRGERTAKYNQLLRIEEELGKLGRMNTF
ncbi:phosphopyruvate hydratase [Candidatus Woesearchaeota archaeon]|nr:MAG: phosphopyruvate hydratase [Candidatus Woesearchaeota archaeon]